jgi:hypothetical protein
MNYPTELALVNPVALNAWPATLLQERVFTHHVKLTKADSGFDHKVVKEITVSKGPEAYYLAGVRVKATAGELPKGFLKIVVDAYPILVQPILYFTKEVDPADIPWLDSLGLFGAVCRDGKRIHPEKGVGFMLPNCSQIEISLKIADPVDADLEIKIIGADYLTQGPPINLKSLKEIA